MGIEVLLEAIDESADIMDELALNKVIEILDKVTGGIYDLPLNSEHVVYSIYSQVWDLLNRNWEPFFEKMNPVADEMWNSIAEDGVMSDDAENGILNAYNESFGVLAERIAKIITKTFYFIVETNGLYKPPYNFDQDEIEAEVRPGVEAAMDEVFRNAIPRIREAAEAYVNNYISKQEVV